MSARALVCEGDSDDCQHRVDTRAITNIQGAGQQAFILAEVAGSETSLTPWACNRDATSKATSLNQLNAGGAASVDRKR